MSFSILSKASSRAWVLAFCAGTLACGQTQGNQDNQENQYKTEHHAVLRGGDLGFNPGNGNRVVVGNNPNRAGNNNRKVRPQACLAWRWLVQKRNPNYGCPRSVSIGGVRFTGRSLFLSRSQRTLPSVMGSACVLEPASSSDKRRIHNSAQLQTSVASGMTGYINKYRRYYARAEKDCLTVTKMAGASDVVNQGALKSSLWSTFQAQFLEQTGHTNLFFATNQLNKVRLGVIDTSPTRVYDTEYYTGTSPHGFGLVNMAKKFLCVKSLSSMIYLPRYSLLSRSSSRNTSTRRPAAKKCLAQVTSQLATSYTLDTSLFPVRDTVKGGTVGTISEIATAIFKEVYSWKTQGGPGKQRLVLNVSLAWLPSHGGFQSNVYSMPYQVQMVYRALEYAACHGALVIGAAGNKIGGERNAYYPAAWEKRPAPNYYYCSRYLKDHKPVRSDFATSTRVYRPIIYAVGGLQGTDKPLANSLPYGMPKLAAYGDHATVQSSLKVGSFYKSTHTTTLTGSSVSSLIVSATASAVWYYKPSLAPHKVMDLVYKTGKWMPFYARFKPSPYSSATRVKQVVFCNALKTVCASGGGNCPASGSYFKCATPKKSRASLSSISSLATFESSADSVEFSLSSPSAPSYQALKAVPWSFPQPGSEPCANCIVDSSNGDLYIEWDSDYDLSNVGIMVNGSSYSLGSDVSGSNYSAVVDLGISGSWDSASLYYNVSDGSSSYWDDSSLYVGW